MSSTAPAAHRLECKGDGPFWKTEAPWQPAGTVKRHADTPGAGRKPQPVPPLVTRLEQLGKMLRPTPHVPLAVEGMNLFAKLEYVNPVGSIKDRPAYWILKRAAERGEIREETTVIESSSGNFAVALAAFTRLLGL